MSDEERAQKTILVVDDIEANIRTLLGILGQFDVIPATSGAEALEILAEEDIHLILLDIMMPVMDGYQVCEAIKSDPASANIPIIFLTAKDDEESIERAYDVGGYDYVTKPFLPRELLARVSFQLRFQEMFQQLEFIASHDTLTGLFNRRKFFELGKALFDSSEKVFAIMLDIDHFKLINDEHGHSVGDEALISITRCLKAHMPAEAFIGRLGGEEFALMMIADDVDYVVQIAEKMRTSVSELQIALPDGGTISANISLGVAEKSEATSSIDDLLNEADKALYMAKNSGRNRSIFRDVPNKPRHK